jgi:hypothetical protein
MNAEDLAVAALDESISRSYVLSAHSDHLKTVLALAAEEDVHKLTSSLRTEREMLEHLLMLPDTESVTCREILVEMTEHRKKIFDMLHDVFGAEPRVAVWNFLEAIKFLLDEAVERVAQREHCTDMNTVAEASRYIRHHAVGIAGLGDLMFEFSEQLRRPC